LRRGDMLVERSVVDSIRATEEKQINNREDILYIDTTQREEVL
jgi:hypothetical protein